MLKDVSKWLKTEPKKSEIVEIQTGKVKDGKAETVKIIPQKIIESLLDELTEQNWSTRNFQFSRWNETIVPAGVDFGSKGVIGRTMCDASLELVVTYRQLVIGPLDVSGGPAMVEKEITRVLVGAVSFDVSFFGNDHVANTAKSLCIVNAASELGSRLGRNLNPKEAAMMIVGMKAPVQVGSGVSGEVKDKISETLTKLTKDLKDK